MNNQNTTQEKRVLEELQKAAGGWINGQYFLKQMFFSQYHRALWNLIHRRERYGYDGQIEVSDFKDEYGFKSYRLVATTPILPPYLPHSEAKTVKTDKLAQERLFKLSPII